jgi:hypothetical protein
MVDHLDPLSALTKIKNVRFGSQADMCIAKSHVRITPNSDRESRHLPWGISALPPKADMCSANKNVR